MVKSTQFRGRLAVGRLPLEQEIDGSNPSPGAKNGFEHERGRENSCFPAWGDSEAQEGGNPIKSS